MSWKNKFSNRNKSTGQKKVQDSGEKLRYSKITYPDGKPRDRHINENLTIDKSTGKAKYYTHGENFRESSSGSSYQPGDESSGNNSVD